MEQKIKNASQKVSNNKDKYIQSLESEVKEGEERAEHMYGENENTWSPTEFIPEPEPEQKLGEKESTWGPELGHEDEVYEKNEKEHVFV